MQIDWSDQLSKLEIQAKELNNSWKYLRAIARQETSSDATKMEKKMKYAQTLTEAAERLKVLEVIHKRVKNRFQKLLLYMGFTVVQAEKQKVSRYSSIVKIDCQPYQ